MTREDFNNLKKAMKDPKFKDLLGDYMMEISDPNNKAEADAYLRQLETDGELPKGMKLIQPTAFLLMSSRIASEDDKVYSQKLYINICTHEDVERAHPAETTGGKGANWQVPYFLGKQRYDQETDAEGNENKVIVCVIDIVFNTNVIGLCDKFRGFQTMLCDISLDAVSKLLAAKKERLDPDYSLIKNQNCKGAAPAVMPIRDSSATGNGAVSQGEKPKIYHEISKMKENANGNQTTIKNAEDVKDALEESSQEEKSDSLTPPYTFSYVYESTSDDYIDSTFKEAKRVSSLKLRVQLRKVEDTKLLKCDFDGESLVLSYGEVYYLNLRLPILVLRENYKAKFDKGKRELNLEFFVPAKQKTVEEKETEQKKGDDAVETEHMVADVQEQVPPITSVPENAVLEAESEVNKTFEKEEIHQLNLDTVKPVEQRSEETAQPEVTVIKREEIPVFNQQTVDGRTFIQLRVDYLGEEYVKIMHFESRVVLLLEEPPRIFYAEIPNFVPDQLTVKFLEGFIVLIYKHSQAQFTLQTARIPDNDSLLDGYQPWQPPAPKLIETPPPKVTQNDAVPPPNSQELVVPPTTSTTVPKPPVSPFNCLKLSIQTAAFELI